MGPARLVMAFVVVVSLLVCARDGWPRDRSNPKGGLSFR